MRPTSGANILGSGVDFDPHMFIGAGAYICVGKRRRCSNRSKANPRRGSNRCSASFGLFGKPTTINTQALTVLTILRKGAIWFAGLGPVNWAGPSFSVSVMSKTGQFLNCRWGSVQGPDGVGARMEGAQAQR